MAVLLIATLAFSAPLQDDSEIRLGGLVKQLGSTAVEEREKALVELIGAGSVALPFLERAAGGSDLEVAARARHIIAIIKLRGRLSPKALEILPGIAERLAGSSPRKWMDEFTRAKSAWEKGKPNPALRREDLVTLALGALTEARTSAEKVTLCYQIQQLQLSGAVSGVLVLLKDSNAQVRYTALFVASMHGTRKLAPHLVPMLNDPSSQVRSTAASTLGDWHANEAVPGLVKLLGDKESSVRLDAAQALARMGAKEAKPALLALLGDEDQYTRAEAAITLADMGAREAIPPLIRMLQDPEFNPRRDAALALGYLGAKEGIPGILARIQLGGANESDFMIQALGRMKALEAVPKLRELLSSQSSTQRMRGLSGLAAVGSTDSVGMIVPLLDDQEEFVRREAVDALVALRATSQLASVVPLLRDPSEYVRASAASAVGRWGNRNSKTDLVKLLNDEDRFVRQEAILALDSLGATDCTPKVREALRDEDGFVRVAAIRFLERVEGAKCLPVLIPMLKEGEFIYDTVDAARAVGRLGRKEYAPNLEALLTSPHHEIRIASATALFTLGSDEGVRTLLEEGGPYTILNRMRQPALWKRLEEGTIETDWSGSPVELLRRVADKLEVSFEASTVVEGAGIFDSDDRPRRVEARGGRANLIDVIEGAVSFGSTDVILESQGMRVVSRKDAQVFWARWWAGREQDTKR